MTEEEFTIAVRAVEEYAGMIEMIQQESTRLKEQIKEHMRTHGLTEIEVDGMHVRLQETHRNHLDVKLLKQMQPDVYRAFCKRLEISRLIIS
ncbi:MAG: hypothetical protein J6D10_12245 [Clostridia bacterium]|nr:hypothetical protein [Clostridia bacterium]